MITLEQYLEKHQLDEKLLLTLGIYNSISQLWSQIDSQNLDSISAQIQAKIAGAFRTEVITVNHGEDKIAVENSLSQFNFRPIKISGQDIPEDITSQTDVDKLALDIVKDPKFKVIKVQTKQMSIKPRPPFTTSTLQQAASSALGFNPRQTMQIAQRLYEGIEIKGELLALITYMRTDSLSLSSQAIEKARKFLDENFKQYLPSSPRLYKSKSKNAQEAHEAIRPIDPLRTPTSLKGRIDPSQWKLYNLIWRQTIQSQMTDEIRELTTFDLENNLQTQFRGTQTRNINLGWKALEV